MTRQDYLRNRLFVTQGRIVRLKRRMKAAHGCLVKNWPAQAAIEYERLKEIARQLRARLDGERAAA